MPHSLEKIEKRLARVEKELAELKAALPARPAKPWYEQIVGDFTGDPAYAEIVRLGRRFRRGKLKG